MKTSEHQYAALIKFELDSKHCRPHMFSRLIYVDSLEDLATVIVGACNAIRNAMLDSKSSGYIDIDRVSVDYMGEFVKNIRIAPIFIARERFAIAHITPIVYCGDEDTGFLRNRNVVRDYNLDSGWKKLELDCIDGLGYASKEALQKSFKAYTSNVITGDAGSVTKSFSEGYDNSN